MTQIFLENLCLCSEFVKMTPDERQKYLDKIYGDDKPHKIFAEITNIERFKVLIKPVYFLTTDGRAIEFRIYRDSELKEIGSGAKFNFAVENIPDHCRKHNLNEGDTIICILQVQTSDYQIKNGHFLTFSLYEVERADFSEIEKFYTKYEIHYETKEIYEIRDDENKSLSAIISADFEKKLSNIAANMELKLQNLRGIISATENVLNEKQSELQSLEDKLNKLKKFYGVEDEKPEEKIPAKFHEEKNFDEYISYWQGHLWAAHDLSYRKEILESVYWGLQTNQLIILTGSPGTGKTSLVRALPKCFDWDDAAIIPVQANWTDKSDLLGYYNPLEKNYMSTPFLDALLKFCRKAKDNPTDKFIICLDEMNLAHVEHYFAEFLSVLQSDRVTRLYSDELRRDIFRELYYNSIIKSEKDKEFKFDEQRFMQMNFEEKKYYLQLCRMANMFFKYPAQFEIPTNIKFFGTLNQDATTLDISPKVIDRSFVIRVEKFDGEISSEKDFKSKLYFFPTSNFASDDSTGTDDFVKNINSIIPLSQRVIKPISKVKNLWQQSEDILIASFLLPKIRFNSKDDSEKIIALKNLCEKYPYSKEILEKYMTSPDGNEIDYWRQ